MHISQEKRISYCCKILFSKETEIPANCIPTKTSFNSMLESRVKWLKRPPSSDLM